jgi:two-component system nitrate/nitrite sensor histidine kinase NarX
MVLTGSEIAAMTPQRPTDRPLGSASAATDILAEITAGLSSETDVAAVLRRFLEPIVRLAHARGGAVRMLCGDDRLRLVSQFGLTPELPCADHAVDRHCGSCGRSVDDDQPVWQSDSSSCRDDEPAPARGGALHLLAVPLEHRGRVLGVYNLFFDDPAAPSDEVRAMLRPIGDLLGLALANARLEAENLRATLMQERQIMAAEVHDAVAQDLTFLRMRLPLLEQAIAAHDDDQARRYLDDLRQAMGRAHSSLRAIVTEFRTPPDPLGLAHGLRAKVDEFAARSGIEVRLDNRAPGLALAASSESQVLHIVGEALSNVARHAHACRAWVSVDAPPGRVEVSVEDDGAGVSTRAAPGHHGLEIMAERARRIGGTLAVEPRSGGGTVVRLTIPAPVMLDRAA